MTALRLPADSRLRLVLDALWVVSFAAVLAVMAFGARAQRVEPGAALDLVPGQQVLSLSRQGRRIGTLTSEVQREGKGWRMERRFDLRPPPAAASRAPARPAAAPRASAATVEDRSLAELAALIRLRLRADLSLAHVTLHADLARLGDLTGVPTFLLRELGSAVRFRLQGECSMETGVCALTGRLGERRLDLPVTAGRGPVVSGALYPLLARGSLGRKVEVNLFDPLSLRQHTVTYLVEGRETLRLPSGVFPATRVRCDVAGFATRAWLDARGLILREELPLGFLLEHESWSALP